MGIGPAPGCQFFIQGSGPGNSHGITTAVNDLPIYSAHLGHQRRKSSPLVADSNFMLHARADRGADNSS